ncbi:MAG: thermonuclease family protein [Rhodospirillales bacterium]|nr:thermonuclease family protein [Rhodospirillales bacterium]
MSKVIRFRRRRFRLPGWQGKRPRPFRSLARTPWQPLVLLISLSAAIWIASEQWTSTTPGQAHFTLCAGAFQKNCVIDGDTIRYRGAKIRVADIDTPEISEPRCASEAALGHRAKLRMLELINDGPFDLHAAGRDVDRYGRQLRTITRDGESLGDILIAEGLARRWDGARRSWCS